MGKYIVSLNESCKSKTIGNKAKNLIFLMRNQFQAPQSWACEWRAQESFLADEKGTREQLIRECSSIIQPGKAYAVRSSASSEDGEYYSFAGLFQSYLNITGVENIVDTIILIWKSARSPSVIKYISDNHFTDKIYMGVIIQEMVQATYSGVAFSKNPLTGLSEVIVEASAGLADMMGQTTPYRWVNKWGEWIEKPQDPNLPFDMIQEVVYKTKQIAMKYGAPVDIEWAYDGLQLYLLQVRKITTTDISIYSNRISKEMLPGIIKPLVYSVNTSLINHQWVNILTRLAGNHSITPESLTGHFYFRAYFNMATFGKIFERLGMPYETLELMMGLENEGQDKPKFHMSTHTVKLIPRFLRFFLSFIRLESRFSKHMSTIMNDFKASIKKIEQSESVEELFHQTLAIFDDMRPIVYYNIVLPLFAMMYNKLLTGQLKKSKIDILNVDMSHIRTNAKQYSPHTALKELNQKYSGQDQINSIELESDTEKFLNEFGHFSDSGNDFSSKPWRESPQLIQMMITALQPESQINHNKVPYEQLSIPWLKRSYTNMLFRRAGRFAVHREAISYVYTYGYGRFRICFLKIGEHFVKDGILDRPEDIFYLYFDEVRNTVEKKSREAMQFLVEDRKKQIKLVEQVQLPELIFGDQQPPIQTGQTQDYQGIPTSLGVYTGTARVLMGLYEFDKLKHGDILIIPYSDVGWTPLFSKAKAVISESGGMLSHSSIIAREYHIPAIVSVKGACSIRDGTILTVNGYTGKIEIVKKAEG